MKALGISLKRLSDTIDGVDDRLAAGSLEHQHGIVFLTKLIQIGQPALIVGTLRVEQIEATGVESQSGRRQDQ